MRIHQSGHMGVLAEDKKDIVKEEFKYYREIRREIPESLPFWPLGLAKDGDDWMSLGLTLTSRTVLAIWRIKGSEECQLPLPAYQGQNLKLKIAFPENDEKCFYRWNSEAGVLTVTMKEEMARIIEIYSE